MPGLVVMRSKLWKIPGMRRRTPVIHLDFDVSREIDWILIYWESSKSRSPW